MPGRSIRIFLPDGSPTGLRTAELGLSTIKAVMAPRTLLGTFAARSEAKRTGVYLLVGTDPDIAGRLKVYVGEGDDILSRVLTHTSDSAKEFFDSIYVFVSKDDNLTKAHVRWLEARLVERLKLANRCTVANKTEPGGGGLPEADVAEMTEYLEQIQLLLSTLGLNAFEPVTAGATTIIAATNTGTSFEFEYSGDGYSGKCRLEDGVFVVLRGSVARLTETASLPDASRATRSELILAGVLKQQNGGLLFEQDYEFDSASRAAQVVCGFSVNGWNAWKRPDGVTLTQWQDTQLRITAGAS